MTKNESLQRKIEAIRELKAEHLIGSQDALAYLRATARYQEICDQLMAGWRQLKLTPRDVALLESDIIKLVQYWMHTSTILRNTPENYWSVPELVHEIPHPCDKYDDMSQYYWNIDLLLVLRSLLLGKTELPNRKTLFEDMFSRVCLGDIFILKSTGERFSGRQIRNDPRFHPQSDTSFSAKLKFAIDFPADDDEESEKFAELQQAAQEKDLQKCFDILRQAALEEQVAEINYWIRGDHPGDSLRLTEAEMEYLFNTRILTERAGRELTLGRLEVERRVAIGWVYTTMLSCPGLSIKDLISQAITDKRRIMTESMARMQRNIQAGAHWLAEDCRSLVSDVRYSYLCLLQNQRWLEKYFSS